MATYYSNVWNTTFGPDDASVGGIVSFAGSVQIPDGVGVVAADVLNLFRLRSGLLVRNVWLYNDDLGSQVDGTFGHFGVDDGLEIDADSIIADVDFEDAQVRKFENGTELVDSAAGASARLGLEFATPFTELTEDAAFKIVLGACSGNTATTSGARYVKFIVECVNFGPARAPFAYTWNGLAGGLSVRD